MASDLQVHARGRTRCRVPVWQLLQDAQRDQRGNALAVGGNLVHRAVAERGGNGLHPLHLVGGQVIGRQRRTAGLGKRCHALRQRAAVEGFGPGAGNLLQRVGLGREAPDLAGLRAPPSGFETR
jgi:hypothetical protein